MASQFFLINVNQLVRTTPESSDKHYRWVFFRQGRGYFCFEKSQIAREASQKIEKVLSNFLEDLNKVENISSNDKANLIRFKELMALKVENYKSKHNMIYLFFSRLFFGNIDTIKNSLDKRVDELIRG